MIILGITEDHNATAAIVKDGRVVACSSEERFSRIKNDSEYPYKAIDSCLEVANIQASQIDYVVFAGTFFDALSMKTKRATYFTVQDYVREMHEHWKKILIERTSSNFWEDTLKNQRFFDCGSNYYNYDFMKDAPQQDWSRLGNESRKQTIVKHLGVPEERIRFIDHHKGHAYYAYFASPHNKSQKAAIVTADGWGDGCNATISVVENGNITEIYRTAMCNMARMYRWTTLILGMKPNEHEYKVMGLAPYAKEYIRREACAIYKNTLVVDGLDFKWKEQPSDMYFYFKERFEGIRFDGIAGGIQMWLEEMLSEWITNIMNYTGTEVLYYSGGLSMNVKANKVIAELPAVKDFYVAPSGGDESLGMGASFALAHELGEELSPLKNAYSGYAPSGKECYEFAEKFSQDSNYTIIDNPDNDMLAQLFIEGKVLGRCVGNMEFGARSLGNRAILCDPSKFENLRAINEKIKFRDFWMPFTPSILMERANDYIVNPKNLRAEYMTIAFDSTPLAREHLKAAIHPYDFTVRPQLVSQESNPEYYALIKAFEKKTGIGALLNTSLNLHGSPIVCTAKDAMETVTQSGLDGMIFSNLIILKSNVCQKPLKKILHEDVVQS